MSRSVRLRFAMIEGGRLSARDPQATFSFAKKENLLAIADEVEEEVFGEGQ